MGHLDGRLVAEVYAKWLEPANFLPGKAAAEVYATEWQEAAGLVSCHNVLPLEDGDDAINDAEDEDVEEKEDF